MKNNGKRITSIRNRERDLAYIVLRQRAQAEGMNTRGIVFKRMVQDAKRKGL